jgi:TM2 domain-containing membrane protein YozV
MKKENIRWILVAAVVLVLYILVAFLIPFVHTATFWVSFVFTLIAFVVVAASFYIAFVKTPDARSKFYGFPIARIGGIYGLAQLAVGFLFMGLGKWIPVWVAVLVYALALGAAVIGLVAAETVVEEIHVQDAKLKKNVTLMRSLQSKVNQMAVQSEDAGIKALADEFRYSDPVSSDPIAAAEADLAAAVDELQAAYIDGDSEAAKQLCRKASALLAERNRLCKLNKN